MPRNGKAGEPAVLRAVDIAKAYGGVVALRGMDLAADRGSIHALVGQNGAGKSTLMRVLAGVEAPDRGSILLDGIPVVLASPQLANARGISIVFQELSLFPDLSVAANLFPVRPLGRRGLVSEAKMQRAGKQVTDDLGLRLNLGRPLSSLALHQRQLVEIARALLAAPRVLILDEPTASLTTAETHRLFSALRRVASSGVAIIYISHRLEEIFELADRITVMRDGQHVITSDTAGLDMRSVTHAMAGTQMAPPAGSAVMSIPHSANESLTIKNLIGGRHLRGINLEARRGQVVGLACLGGEESTELLLTLFGERRIQAGEVSFPDGGRLPRSANAACRRRIAYVPGERRTAGIMLERSVADNVSIVAVAAMPRRFGKWLSSRELTARAQRHIDLLLITCPSADTAIAKLSGGSQQKVVLAKWLEVEPSVVLLDDPTRGVDVRTKQDLYRLIREIARRGNVVLFASSDLPEILELSDSVAIFRGGRVASHFPANQIGGPAALLNLMNLGEEQQGEHS